MNCDTPQTRNSYKGLVDDPRNTDKSWMETVAILTLLEVWGLGVGVWGLGVGGWGLGFGMLIDAAGRKRAFGTESG